MSKLLKLKEWVSVAAAAKHISIMVGEEVTVADTLRLGLDGHVRLSVNLVNGATAQLWQVIDRGEVSWKTVPSLEGKQEVQLPIGGPIWIHDDGRVFQLKPQLLDLEPGVWDLPLIGPEVHDIEREYQRLTGGPEYTMQSLLIRLQQT